MLWLFVGQLAAVSAGWWLRWGGHVVGLAVVLLTAGVMVGVIALPDPAAGLRRTIAEQVDAEDAALCQRFGFAAGTSTYASCKFDLADLRHRDEEMWSACDWP